MKKKNQKIAMEAIYKEANTRLAMHSGYWMFFNGIDTTGDKRSLKEIRDGLLKALRSDKDWDEHLRVHVEEGIREAYDAAYLAILAHKEEKKP